MGENRRSRLTGVDLANLTQADVRGENVYIETRSQSLARVLTDRGEPFSH